MCRADRAELLLGFRVAEHVGAIDRRQREVLWQRGQAAFHAVAEQQGEHQRAADPVARFPEMVAAIISSGRGHVAGADGKEPCTLPSPEAWGWEGREARSGLGEMSVAYRGRGHKIGWVAGDELYLDPDSTYAALSDFAREQGQAYPVTQQTLFRRLKEDGQLLRTDSDRTTYPVTLEGSRRRVLVLARSLLFGEPGQPGRPGHGPANGAESVPVSCPGFQSPGPKPGHETGTRNRDKSLWKAGSCPDCPGCPGFGRGGGSWGYGR